MTKVDKTIFDSLDYQPYGEQLGGDTGTTHKFTGQERDGESGLDYFGARFYASGYGRFMSPDSTSYSSSHSPQSWNLYAYTLNNPLKYVDPTGNSVELSKCADKQKCAKALGAATGNKEGASRVYVNTVTQKAGWLTRLLTFGRVQTVTRSFVGIQGDVKTFAALSPNAAKLADLVQSKTNVQFSISPTYRDPAGAQWTTAGGFSGTPSQGYSEPIAVVDPNPASFDPDTRGLIGAQVGDIPGANVEETAAHELLGHMWAELFGGQPAGTFGNAKAAVISENEVRKTDPTRGLKIRHGDFGQVLTTKDVPPPPK